MTVGNLQKNILPAWVTALGLALILTIYPVPGSPLAGQAVAAGSHQPAALHPSPLPTISAAGNRAPAPGPHRRTFRRDGTHGSAAVPIRETDLTGDLDRETGPIQRLDPAERALVDALADPRYLRRLREMDPGKSRSGRLPQVGDPRPASPDIPRNPPWSEDQLLANPTDMNDEYVSLAQSPVSGNLYAVFAAKDLGGTDRDIHIAVSTDDGQSWTVHEMPSSSIDEYQPEIAVDGGGYIHVVWIRDDGWVLRSRTSAPDDVGDWAWVKGLGTDELMATPSIAVSGAGDFAKVFIAAGWRTVNYDLYQYEWTLIFMYSTNGGQTVTYDYFLPDGYQDLWPDVALDQSTVHFVNAQVDYYTGETEILVASDALTGSFADPGMLTGYTTNSCGFPQIACQGSDVFIVFQEDYSDGVTVDGDIIYTYSWDAGGSYYGPFGLIADEYESVGPSVFTHDGVVGVLWLDGPPGADEFDLAARLGGGRGHTGFFGGVEMVSEQPRVEPMFHSCFGLADGNLVHAAWIDRRDFPTQGHNVYTSRQLVAPNISPIVPEGWSDSLVGNILRGSRSTGYLASEDTTYISFAFANTGLADVEGPFSLQLLLDGQPLQQWTLSGGLPTGTWFPVEDLPLFMEEEGDYTLAVDLDCLGQVAESNEGDNLDSRTWTWVPGNPRMRFTPGHITRSIQPEMSRTEALRFMDNPILRREVSLPVIDSRLAAAMDRAGEGQLLRVMIVPADRLDPPAMAGALRGATRATRREVITGAAKTHTRRVMDGLAPELDAMKARGQADSIVPLWLTGMIQARLAPDAVVRLADDPVVGTLFLDDVESEVFATPASALADPEPLTMPGGKARADAWHIAAIGADEAWARGITGQGILVGHLDTGVAYDHPDLAAGMWDGGSEFPHHGWDSVDDDDDPYDGDTDFGHGTHTAGLIIGDGTGGTATGVAPGATLMTLRALPGFLGDMIEAMQFGLDHGVHLFSLSGGWGQADASIRGANRYNAELLLSIDVPWICAAGNGDNYGGHYPVPTDIASPGDCPNPWFAPNGGATAVVTVGAVNQDLSVWAYSSNGPTAWDIDNTYGDTDYHDYPYPGGLMKPDLAVPGGNITSTNGSSGYVVYSGTSMATPLVTGTFCLLWSDTPQLLVPQVCELLETTAVDLATAPAGPGRDNYTGAGLVDIPAALGQMPTAEAELFWIHNDGDLPLIIRDITWSDPWLDIVVPEMVVAPDDSVRATALIDPVGLPEGYYNANVVFTSNEHRPGRVLPVTLIYGDQFSTAPDQGPPAPRTELSNYPNPFNPRTMLQFETRGAGSVDLAIFDLRGRLVRTLLHGRLPAGRHQAVWDGLDEAGQAVASGPYFARLRESDGPVTSRKLMLVR